MLIKHIAARTFNKLFGFGETIRNAVGVAFQYKYAPTLVSSIVYIHIIENVYDFMHLHIIITSVEYKYNQMTNLSVHFYSAFDSLLLILRML